MYPASKNKPTQAQLILPLVETIIDERLISAKSAADALANKLDIPTDVTQETIQTKDGQRVAVWRRHVRYAAMKARDLGLIELRDGLWSAADNAGTRIDRTFPTIVVTLALDDAGIARAAKLDVSAAVPSTHHLICGDSRDLSFVAPGSIGLVVTSCPYHDLLRYADDGGAAQLGHWTSYEGFLNELDRVWAGCFQALTPGGRLACVVGDVLRSRKATGRHHVLPLGADIAVRCRTLGFDALTPIHWVKRTNLAFEQGGKGRLGKPGQPNNIIQAESETILLLRKPGGYRHPSKTQQNLSTLTREEEDKWLRQYWSDVPGERRRADGHAAPYPVEIAQRLIRLFSYAGDTVLDPFSGSFTTTIAAMNSGRHSIGVELSPAYFNAGLHRVEHHAIQTNPNTR